MIDLPKKEPCDIVSVSEVAQYTGVTNRSVRRWCALGKMKSTKLGQEYAILWQDFVSFWQERYEN